MWWQRSGSELRDCFCCRACCVYACFPFFLALCCLAGTLWVEFITNPKFCTTEHLPLTIQSPVCWHTDNTVWHVSYLADVLCNLCIIQQKCRLSHLSLFSGWVMAGHPENFHQSVLWLSLFPKPYSKWKKTYTNRVISVWIILFQYYFWFIIQTLTYDDNILKKGIKQIIIIKAKGSIVLILTCSTIAKPCLLLCLNIFNIFVF